ncbi:16S rRNA (guanine(527)-N(7))-methyltransferase RsmG [Chlorobaculum thiosulfatiphilum]|jgi:16S rRNA (guanine527-N7)-methyltransferase|uniref:Ribosomal RNA small subunit methyltransferase G n=1 Tax=Chlorobaculum thiosulfatiphilum TaxID=115852 RepID=A0A5C4S6C3_CHLTI|nr:16S rRNA (guanine(527)-N(7))-methyltransferase RsmG [Chlorobaculum thiosulfatiphilum]TNJ38261.1 16S rRNA (guanine(527)-N(7))-methyltransferase RsmG [Chlorobaculum thiosulfatiphilum]
MPNDPHLIEGLCRQHGIPATKKALILLERYAALLDEWNLKVNLVSRKEHAPVIIKHVFHSMLVARIHDFKPGEKVLDLGTGGGLPGIPLAILFPETSFLLVDSTGKKIAACKSMIKELGLGNAIALHTRVEELRGVIFDTVLSRQVAPLEELCAYSARLLKRGGVLICLKGGSLNEEIAQAVLSREKHLGFPASVDQLPIGEIDPMFSEKQIVIARW